MRPLRSIALAFVLVLAGSGAARAAWSWPDELAEHPRMLPLLVLVLVSLVGLVVFQAWTLVRLRRSLAESAAARAEVEASEARFRALTESMTVGLLALQGTRIVRVNAAMARITGYTVEELLGMEGLPFAHPEDREAIVARTLRRQSGEEEPGSYEVRLMRKDGTVRWVSIGATRTVLDGEPAAIGTLVDVTERHELERQLRESEKRHRLLADNASDVIWVMGLDGRFQYVSPSVKKLRGYTAAEVLSQSMEEVLFPEDAERLAAGLGEAIEAMARGEPFPEYRVELRQPCKDGSIVWTEVTASGIHDEAGNFVGILGVSRDIGERRRVEDRLAHQANHDVLTDLPNRALLMERVEAALVEARRGGHRAALCFLDLDQFKPVNDAWGHAAGDALLQRVAERLQSRLRTVDTVARVGGDEFVLLLPNVASEEVALAVANKVRSAMEEPFDVEGHEVRLSATIGVALFPDHAGDADGLKRHADVALYAAKAAGRNRVLLWDPALVPGDVTVPPAVRANPPE